MEGYDRITNKAKKLRMILEMDTFEQSVRKRTLIAIVLLVAIALVLGFFWVNQNNCDLVGNVERHDCDLSKLE